MKFLSLLLLFIAALHLGCENVSSNNPSESKLYTDVPAVVSSLQNELKKSNPSVLKTVQVDEKVEKIITKDIDWEKELTLFQDLDLNKTAFRGQFSEQKTIDGSIKYVAKTDDMLIRSLDVQMDSKSQKPVRISATWKNSNILYETYRKLTMDLASGKLSRYAVDTKQKLRFGELQTLRIEGIIQL